MDQRSLFLAKAEAEAEGKKTFCFRMKAEAEGLKITIFLQKIEEHLFIMLLKLVISTLPYDTLAIDLKTTNFW